MASIDDLKKNASPVRITLNAPKTPKPNIKEDKQEDRIVIDMSDMKPKDEFIYPQKQQRTIASDILDLENPDSPINKYIKEQEIGMAKMIADMDAREKLAENDFIDEDGNIVDEEDESSTIGFDTSVKDDEKVSNNIARTNMKNINVQEQNLDELEKEIINEEKENIPPKPTKKSKIIVVDTPVSLNNDNKKENKEEENVVSEVKGTEVLDEEIEETTKNIQLDTPKDPTEPVKSQKDPDAVDMDKELEDIEKEDIIDQVEEEEQDEEDEISEEDKEVEEDLAIEMEEATTEFKDLDDDGNEIADESENLIETSEVDTLKELQKLATEKLKPVSKSLDITSFTRAKKPTANLKMLSQSKAQVNAAKWILPEQNSIVMMKEFLGSELEELRANSSRSDNLVMLNRRYRMIYDHIVSAKPDSYEVWCKTTPYADIDHYFFAAYIASFHGTNFLPMTCVNSKCNKMSLTDDIPVMQMVKFDDDKSKNKFMELYKSNREKGSDLYVTEVVPLSDKIAVGFKAASIYSLFEIASLEDRFRTRFSNIIDYVPYIDCAYLIDQENQQLVPVGYKVYPDNATKTTKSKIVMLNKVLESLTIDQFGPIKAYVNALIGKSSDINFHYIIPEFQCPHCNTKIEEAPITAEELVFTRYQLGALTSTSIS